MEDGKWKMEEGAARLRPYRGGRGMGLARFWLATLGEKQFIGWLEF